MKPITISELCEKLGGELNCQSPCSSVYGFATDSREINPGDVFLAIQGERVDGHQFTDAARKNGAVASLVTRPVEGCHILVADLPGALARMASGYRAQFHGPVVGITGSAGKTTTKEFLAAALTPLGPVLKTEGNRNTELTLPLAWAELTPEHQAAVVEMGMRGPGQITHLAAFCQPTIGLITNIGHSHLSQVGSREGIARAKGELLQALPAGGTAILWRDDTFYEMLKDISPCPVRTFGFSSEADCLITRYTTASWSQCIVEGVLEGRRWSAELPAVGRHIALNAAAAVLAATAAGVEPAEAATAMGECLLPPMRMEILNVNGATIVMDAYNASPASTISALETMAQLPSEGRRIAVIGEMRELGEFSEEGHREVGRALVKAGIDETMFYGDATVHSLDEAILAGISPDCVHRADSLFEVTGFLRGIRPGDTVLIKGSRALELEKALEPLQAAGAGC